MNNKDMRDIGQGTIRKIDWQEFLPIVFLARTFRIAAGFRPLACAIAGVLLMTGVGFFVNYFPVLIESRARGMRLEQEQSQNPEFPVEVYENEPSPSGEKLVRVFDELKPAYRPTSEVPFKWDGKEVQVRGTFWGEIKNTILVPWEVLTKPFTNCFAPGDTFFDRVISICWFFFVLAIWTFFGGTITRTAAVKLTVDQYEDKSVLGNFLNQRWKSYLGAILLPIIAMLICSLPLIFAGWAITVPILNLVTAILFPIILIAAACLVFLGIGLVFAWPLMFAAISVEGTDAFDAVSRAYSYLYQRPLQYIVYTLSAGIIGYLGWLFVSVVVDGTLAVTVACSGIPESGLMELSNIMMLKVREVNVPEQIPMTTLFVQSWVAVLNFVKIGYVFSFFWVSSTAIYLLLRKSVDNVPLDVVKRVGPAAKTRKLPVIPEKPAASGEEHEVN